MLAKLLKLVPIKTILRAGAMLLLSKRTDILAKVERLIWDAQISIASGPAKFEFVKAHALALLQAKAGYLFDTGIQMLVAWVKLDSPQFNLLPQPANMKVETTLG